MAASALLSSLCLAASFAVPEMPDAEWDDTEVVTNAALPAVRADSRVFAFSLELDATASNNVEVAFGSDADHDGVLSRAGRQATTSRSRSDATRSRRSRQIRRDSSIRRNGTRCVSSAGAWILRTQRYLAPSTTSPLP